MIAFQGVGKLYDGKKALDQVTFSLPEGKIIGVVGPNGSGKSTLLQLMAGLIYPSWGTVTIDGDSVDRRICRKVSYLSEKDQLYPFFTVWENILFHASQFPDFNLEKAGQILEFMKLDPGIDVNKLSKGYRGRLKMVLALSREVPWILMDEPLSGFDPMVRDSILRSLVSFVDPSWQTLIITTHEVSEIEPILDMVLAVHNGEILRVTDVEEIREEEGVSIVEWMKKVYV